MLHFAKPAERSNQKLLESKDSDKKIYKQIGREYFTEYLKENLKNIDKPKDQKNEHKC